MVGVNSSNVRLSESVLKCGTVSHLILFYSTKIYSTLPKISKHSKGTGFKWVIAERTTYTVRPLSMFLVNSVEIKGSDENRNFNFYKMSFV